MPYNNSKILLEGISNLCPIYYVTGNHEYWSYDTPNIFSILKGYNIDVLEGANSIVNINNTPLNICGVSDPSIFHYTDTKTTTYAQLKHLSTTLDDNHFNILLSHRPELIDSYCKYDFDLVTCGHTHGGQWRIPGLINGLYSPNQGLFPKYVGGQYDLDSLTMIISRGLARESSIIPRIFNRPELVVINLKQE